MNTIRLAVTKRVPVSIATGTAARRMQKRELGDAASVPQALPHDAEPGNEGRSSF